MTVRGNKVIITVSLLIESVMLAGAKTLLQIQTCTFRLVPDLLIIPPW